MIVIDASVAIKILYQEDASDIARNLLKLHSEKKEEIITSSLLFIEVANALATKSSYSKMETKKGVNLLYSFNFSVYEIIQSDLIKASMLAKQYKTSVYDMLYAVIAKNKKIKLITADARFAKKVGFSYVKHLSDSSVFQLAPKP